MEDNSFDGDPGTYAGSAVEGEVAGFFRSNPFLLISEERLSSLLCRPPEMVREAVMALEEAGLLSRRLGDTLLGAENSFANSDL